MKNKRGITLITLVVTIIVLLILAGVTINSIIGDNGIISQAKNAKDKTLEAQTYEEALLNGKVTIDGVTYDSIDDYLDGKPSSSNSGSDPTIEANIDDIIYPPTEEFTEIKTETDWYTDANNETYVVPKGFAIGKSEGINTVAEGLVITDSVELINGKYYSNGNEFVWIPVRFGEFSRVSFMPRTNHTTNVSSDFVEDEDAAYSEMKYYTENMYRGFYIARYEAGCVTGRTFNGPNTSNLVPLSKKGLYPYNFVTWAEAKAASESMYPKTNEPGDYDVVSTLCYGVQWDSIMRYLKRYDSNIDLVTSYDYGNTYTHGFHYMGKYYYEDHYNNANWEDCNSGWLNSDVNIENNIKSNNVERLLQTGASENNKTKNIYDLLGNVAEQTMECYKVDDDTYEHVTRGGNFIEHGYCMSERDQFSQADYEETCYYGFRPALYIKAEWDYE